MSDDKDNVFVCPDCGRVYELPLTDLASYCCLKHSLNACAARVVQEFADDETTDLA